MASRSTRSGVDRAAADTAFLPPFNFLADLPRRQLAFMTQTTAALLRSSEEVQRIQHDAAQRASEETEAVAQRLRGDCDFNDLLSVQAELLRFNLQEAAQVWQQVTTASLRIGADMVSTASQAAFPGAPEPTLETLQRAFAATFNGGAASAVTH